MSHPIGYYTDYTPGKDAGTPLDILQERFGSTLEGLEKQEKLALLSVISTNLTICCTQDEDETLEDTYLNLPDAVALSGSLEEMLDPLNQLRADDLLGLCEALVNQIRNGGQG